MASVDGRLPVDSSSLSIPAQRGGRREQITPGPAGRPERARRSLRDLLGPLFPTRPAKPLTRRTAGLAALAVAAGTAVSLGRIGGPGPFDSIFAEDGSNFLTDSFTLGPLRAVLTPFNGYYHIGPRLLSEVASQVPVAWAPAVLTIEAALVTALVALGVYIASGTHLRSTAARVMVSLPVLAVPVAENFAATSSNDIATLQFFGLYLMFWLLLWVPGSRLGQVSAVLAVGITAFSTLLASLFLPLALLRLVVRRRLPDRLMAGLLAAGTAMHVTALAMGWTRRPSFLVPRWDPVWAANAYLGWGLPHSILGYHWFGKPLIVTSGYRVILVAAAWLIVVTAVGLAVLRWRSARAGTPDAAPPARGLALVAGVYGFGLALFQTMASGRLEERYLITPGLLVVVALAALLQPSRTLVSRVPFGAFAVLLAVVMAVNYQDPTSLRTSGPAWSDGLRQAVAACKADPQRRFASVTAVLGSVRIPCEKLR